MISLKKILFLILLPLSIHTLILAQDVRGIIIDEITLKPVSGVSISSTLTKQQTVSDSLGHFMLTSLKNNETVTFKHIAYQVKKIVFDPNKSKFDNILLLPASVDLQPVQIIAGYVKERSAPIAVSAINARTMEQKLGNQDFPEIMKQTPGIYATKQGGGSGDNRVSLRGFQQENIALLLNGVPVSSMENGMVHWSNWAGLADATESIQVQRGLAASRVAMNSVGGTINIITKSARNDKFTTLRYGVSDYGNSKTTLTFSTGKMKNGLSLLFLGSRTKGPGYVDGTYVDGYSYLVSLSKDFGAKHRLVYTVMGSPERHGQRNYEMTKAEFDKFGIRYNNSWGVYNGRIMNLSENFYHKPQMTLNHYWTVSPKVFVSTSAYFALGNGGGRFWATFGNEKPFVSYIKNNQIDFDAVWAHNIANTDSVQLADGRFVKGYSKNILTHFRANHYWAGLLSSTTVKINENLKVLTGFHARTFKSHVYQEINDLMGGQYWVETYMYSRAGVAGRNQIKQVGDVIGLDNYAIMQYGNIFGHCEYKKDNWSAFVALTGSGTSYQREDPYNYIENPLSEKISKYGFDSKMGIGYQLGDYGNAYANIGFYSREPLYKFVFINYGNDVVKNLINEKITTAEIGYTFNSGVLNTRFNLYYTLWKDKSLLTNEYIQNKTHSMIRGMNAIHKGIEMEIQYKPFKNFVVNGVTSLGDWTWKNDVHVDLYDDNAVLIKDRKIYIKDLKVGDAPQTQLGLNAAYTYESIHFSIDWNYYDKLYAAFNPTKRINPDDTSQPFKLPAYSMLDASAGYDFNLQKTAISLQIICQNIFDKKAILRGEDGIKHDMETFSGFWSFGRTFNFSVKLSF